MITRTDRLDQLVPFRAFKIEREKKEFNFCQLGSILTVNAKEVASMAVLKRVANEIFLSLSLSVSFSELAQEKKKSSSSLRVYYICVCSESTRAIWSGKKATLALECVC